MKKCHSEILAVGCASVVVFRGAEVMTSADVSNAIVNEIDRLLRPGGRFMTDIGNLVDMRFSDLQQLRQQQGQALAAEMVLSWQI